MNRKKVKRIFKTTVLAIVLVCSYFQYPLFSSANIKWETDWENSLKNAAEKKQPVFMDFYTDWCPPCKKLVKITFKDKNVIDYFKKENYLLIKVNPEKDRVAEEKFKVYSYPTLVIFNAKGAEIDRLLGYHDPEELTKALEDVKKGIGTLEDLLSRYEKAKREKTENTTKGFQLMFKIMDKYIARADYPDALTFVAQIVELDKDNAQKQASAALYKKGYIYYKWKKYKEAVDAMLSIHKIYPDSQEAASGYGAAAYYAEKMGDTAGTLRILKNFVKDYPTSEYAKKTRKKIKKLEKKAKQ